MINPADARWIKSTANELNNLLQVIAESGEQLAGICNEEERAQHYVRMLRESVQRAVLVTRSIAEHVANPAIDAAGDEPAAAVQMAPSLRVLTSASAVRFEIHNPTGSKELILVVDDEEFITQLAARVLSDEGYRVVTAKDGMEAIAIYREMWREVALVILDFMMPVMDGADVFAELQGINPKVPVVLSSGFAEHERLRVMLARGLRGFIPKPYSYQKLLDQVRQTLQATR